MTEEEGVTEAETEGVTKTEALWDDQDEGLTEAEQEEGETEEVGAVAAVCLMDWFCRYHLGSGTAGEVTRTVSPRRACRMSRMPEIMYPTCPANSAPVRSMLPRPPVSNPISCTLKDESMPDVP